MKYLLTLDTGMSFGATLGSYSETEPYERLAFWQQDGGLDGFLEWLDRYHYPDEGYGAWWDFPEAGIQRLQPTTFVVEKFVPLATDRAFRTDELEPLRFEGALIALGHDIIWQRASCQVLAGGDTPKERKKNSDNVLKKLGLWTTGSDVGMKDSDDVRSATKHAVHWLIANGHRPTIDAIMKEQRMLIKYNPSDDKTYVGHYNKAGRFIREKGYYFSTHPMEACEGRSCCIHNPSEHRLSNAPLNWRADRRIMERICKHGIGHPDPDDAAYIRSTGLRYDGVHGCCGECCGTL